MGRMLLRGEAADLLGIAPDTFSAYVSRQQAPQPAERIGSTPRWDEDELVEWIAGRPGRGGRPLSKPPTVEGGDQ